jgi:glycosyltransferase involved in cell wall biosynthesis
VIVGNSPVCLMARALGKKVVLNVDGADAERDKWRGFAKTYIRCCERLAPWAANVVIADSPVISARYRQEFGYETVYIPYGANPRPREREAGNTSVLERFGLKPDGYILFVSRLTPENKAHLLIEAFKQAGVGLKLAIVGDAPYEDSYKKSLFDLCRNNPQIILTGYLFGEAYRQISSHCRFFVLPSGIEGTRPVLLDQMGFGNCVLVRNNPANLAVIGEAGVSFEHHRELDSLTAKIRELSADYLKVEHYRTLALARVVSEYSWDRITDQYETLFRKLLARER